MRKKKPFLIVFVAIVLACSIPISASAFGQFSPYDSDFDYFTYGGAHVSSAHSPWFHVFGQKRSSNISESWEGCGKIHCGNARKAFLMWIPFQGWYLVSVQSSEMHIDLNINSGTQHAFYTVAKYSYSNSLPNAYQSYRSWYGDGYLSRQNIWCFQTYFLGNYYVFYCVQQSDFKNMPTSRAEGSGLTTPTDDEKDEIGQFLYENSGDISKPFGDAINPADIEYIEGTETPTTPDGSEVMTNEQGNPIPTYPDGTPAPTYPNGNPAPTEPDGTPASTYPNGNPIPSTVYNGDFGNELNTEFSKLYSLVNDLDQASSIMESNAEIMSSHCDSTRSLLNDVIGWLPSSVIACLVCGCIMIIAVKITGSGKS